MRLERVTDIELRCIAVDPETSRFWALVALDVIGAIIIGTTLGLIAMRL